MSIFKTVSEFCGPDVTQQLHQNYAGRTVKISRVMDLEPSTLQALEPFLHRTIYVPRILDRLERNREIRTLRSHGESYPTLSEIFCLSRRHIRSIVNP